MHVLYLTEMNVMHTLQSFLLNTHTAVILKFPRL